MLLGLVLLLQVLLKLILRHLVPLKQELPKPKLLQLHFSFQSYFALPFNHLLLALPSLLLQPSSITIESVQAPFLTTLS